jgi:hypothetical protein
MVLSGTKRTSSISSIVNQPQGGGMKKAGLAPTEAISSAQRRSYNSSGGLLNMTFMNRAGGNVYVAGKIGK